MEYADFLNEKSMIYHSYGHDCHVNLDNVFDYQKAAIEWCCKKGRSALFADCGLGKTICSLKWSESVNIETKKPVLIVAPLSVSKQTYRESEKFGIRTNLCSSQEDVIDGINITNYEKLNRFDTSVFAGVVIDESSILKSFTSATRNFLINAFQKTPYRLACTATPAPNDFMEIGNHAEFLDVMSRTEMLSMFFVNDQKETQKWRLKGHAQKAFWKWMASWSLMFKKPSDIGFDDCGFELPELNIYHHVVEYGKPLEGYFFKDYARTLSEQRQARRESMNVRLNKSKEIIKSKNKDQWIVWCDLNDESSLIKKEIDNFTEVKGSDKDIYKAETLDGFSKGEIERLVTKTSISGFGMNYQSCSNMLFFGLSHSYEAFYQAVRRCWRYGQKKPVNVHVVISDIELPVLDNIERKHKQAEEMQCKMIENMIEFTKSEIRKTAKEITIYKPEKQMTLPEWL